MATDKFDLTFTDEVRKSSTGAQRSTAAGRGRFDLIWQEGIRRLAVLLERGAEKRGERNWEKGMNLSWYYNSAQRHLLALGAGDRGEDHMAALQFNALAFEFTLQKVIAGELPYALVDMPGFDALFPLVPTSLGKPVTARSGGSLPAGLTTYQDQENYTTKHGNPDLDDLRPYLEAWEGRKGERRGVRDGPGRRNNVICARTPACSSPSSSGTAVVFHDVNDCPYGRQPDDFDTGPEVGRH